MSVDIECNFQKRFGVCVRVLIANNKKRRTEKKRIDRISYHKNPSMNEEDEKQCVHWIHIMVLLLSRIILIEAIAQITNKNKNENMFQKSVKCLYYTICGVSVHFETHHNELTAIILLLW